MAACFFGGLLCGVYLCGESTGEGLVALCALSLMTFQLFSLGSHSPLSRGIRATGARGPAAGGREAARRVLGAAPRVRAPLLAVSDLRRYSRYQARRDRRGAGDRSLDRPS